MTRSIKSFLLVVFASAALLGSAVTANATVDYPPVYRGDPNSVHAIFTYVGPGVPWSTDLFEMIGTDYPPGPFSAVAYDDGVTTTVELPNFVDDLSVKHMRIQMNFQELVLGEILPSLINVYGFDDSLTPNTTWSVIDWSTGLDYLHYVDIDIWPNPDVEIITIGGADSTGGLIGEPGSTPIGVFPPNLWRIEVDTVSVPEPMTMSLLAAGGLALLRRRSRTN